MCCMKTNPKVARCPQPASQAPHGEDAQKCGDCTASMAFPVFLRNRQQTQVLPARPQGQPHMWPVMPHLLVRPAWLLQTSQPFLIFWTCSTHVTDEVFLKTSWLKEKNNFGCLGFAQLALLVSVAVLQERAQRGDECP